MSRKRIYLRLTSFSSVLDVSSWFFQCLFSWNLKEKHDSNNVNRTLNHVRKWGSFWNHHIWVCHCYSHRPEGSRHHHPSVLSLRGQGGHTEDDSKVHFLGLFMGKPRTIKKELILQMSVSFFCEQDNYISAGSQKSQSKSLVRAVKTFLIDSEEERKPNLLIFEHFSNVVCWNIPVSEVLSASLIPQESRSLSFSGPPKPDVNSTLWPWSKCTSCLPTVTGRFLEKEIGLLDLAQH